MGVICLSSPLILLCHIFSPYLQMWAIATNKLIFTNPYKMKMSIVLGVMQMLFSVILSIINYV